MEQEKEEKYWENEDQILNSSIPYRISANISSHILINLWFHHLEHITIILKIPKKLGKENILRDQDNWQIH